MTSEAEHGTSRRRAATREKLVAAAMLTFARKGVLGASVEEICEAAGFTRGAFYSNFASRDELCLEILRTHGEFYLAAAEEALARIETTSHSVDELLEVAVGVFISSMSEDPSLILAMNELRLYAAREPAIRQAYQEVDESLTPAFTTLIGQGLERFGLRLSIPTDQVIALLHAIYEQTALDELIHGRRPNSPLVGSRLAAVLRALVIPSGAVAH